MFAPDARDPCRQLGCDDGLAPYQEQVPWIRQDLAHRRVRFTRAKNNKSCLDKGIQYLFKKQRQNGSLAFFALLSQ